MTDTQPSRGTRFVAASLLWGFWAVSALPLFVLYFEFQCRQLDGCGAEWWYYARFYSHFFLYPVTFGLISTLLLHRPWIWSVHHLCSLPERTRYRIAGFFVIAMLVVVGFASLVEFSKDHSNSGASQKCGKLLENWEWTPFSGATPAPWSIAPAIMDARAEGGHALDLLQKRCGGNLGSSSRPKECTLRLLLPGFMSSIAGLCEESSASSPGSLSDAEKCRFQGYLSLLWDDGDRRSRSYTEASYNAGFVGMTALFAVLFATVVITMIWNSNKEDSKEERSENRRMLFLVTLALFFATFWMLMRIAFLTEKLSIYPEDPLLMFNWLIFLAFVALYVQLATTRWPRSEPYERLLNIVLSVAGIASGFAGVFQVGSRAAEWIPDVLVDLFGTGSSPETYVAVLLFLLVVHFPYIVRFLFRLLEGDPKPDDPKRSETT